jgi:hypothetical protein
MAATVSQTCAAMALLILERADGPGRFAPSMWQNSLRIWPARAICHARPGRRRSNAFQGGRSRPDKLYRFVVPADALVSRPNI